MFEFQNQRLSENGICATIVSQPCGSDSNRNILKVEIKDQVSISPQVAYLCSFHSVVAENIFLTGRNVFRVAYVGDWEKKKRQCARKGKQIDTP